jgi:MFS family permease
MSARTAPIVWLMFGIGALMALAWASVSQFLVPLRGSREFGLDRGGVSMLLATSHLVDLAVLLPVGWLADRVGRLLVLGGLTVCVGFAVWGAGLGALPLFILGCVLLGVGMAGWMLPLGIIREHTPLQMLAWRTGLYRVGVDAAAFLGPLICGVLGESHTTVFIVLLGAAALALGGRVLWRVLA